ncbi:oxygen-independent coproporphyrinogen III oxidase [Endozoicomonas sp. OPT23]|uniref:oxygen-independent coproporphyrinogen III oxidase n=1 Tax=Endozoicomonas sp. OPT23 TaxID=2072845 RepID=UPI00129ABBB9|nr:oxygen-independent coproporphyrinogen III oxidase [Endozoicomonas sp. OPT23]MRI35421.1 oxygen-independent coproporphyrinogen III oxidase [Endozoicomonas sp. OPT23]
MSNAPIWDTGLIKKYDLSGPRYTSYPTAVQFREDFDAHHFESSAWRSAAVNNPLSLYIHIPFCTHVCYYCACNKIVTKHKSKAEEYLDYLFREIEMQAELFGDNQLVEQLHFGGGTPTFLTPEQITRVMAKLRKHFNMAVSESMDYSIELDPREVDWVMMQALRDQGFNRISIGVQDLDEKVQRAVNRVQPEEQVRSVLDAARTMAFNSVHMDLIYGLPFQTVDGFLNTVDRIIDMAPDRLSLFNYAHLPHRFKPQRRINDADLPSAEDKLKILELATKKLIDRGYVYIGMDHFALPDDELATAQETGTLHRNFQGYTTHSHCDLVAMGVSSISKVGQVFSQNHVGMDAYTAAIDAGKLPAYRGLMMTREDEIRQSVINELICHFHLEKANVEKKYDIVFDEYFADALEALIPMREDGLLTLTEKDITVESKGRILIRNICMQFDDYFQKQKELKLYSKVI